MFLFMQILRLGIKHRIDVSSYLNPGIDWGEMKRIREELESDK